MTFNMTESQQRCLEVSNPGTATDTHDISCDKGQDTYHEAETFHDRIVIISIG